MKIWLNGQSTEVNGMANIAELAAHYGFQPKTVLIEHNATALRQREWEECHLAEGDRVEVVRVVAGG